MGLTELMRHIACTQATVASAGFALVSLLATGAASAAPALFPAPQQCAVGEQRLPLPAEVVIAVGENASPTELYAAETLVRDLAERSQCQAKLARPGEPGADSATVVLGQAGANPALWELVAKLLKEPLPAMPATAAPEGYTLRVTAVEGRPLAIVQGVDASGTLYGSLALEQLFERRDDGLGLPVPVEIQDAPVMITRAYTGCSRDVTPAGIANLDWMTRCRLNTGYYEMYADQGQLEVPDVVADLVRECDRRGITLFGCLSNWRTEKHLKRELCPSNAADVALIEGQLEQFAARGCHALVFLFDDIVDSTVCHTATCAACKTAFGDLAGVQNAWIRKMAAVAAKHGITRLLVCPTPYFRGWEKCCSGKLDGVAYYAKFAQGAEFATVQQYFCPFSPAEVAAAEKAGLRNFVWWQNGCYGLPGISEAVKALGLWGGAPQVAWGWYGAEWKSGEGPLTSAETLADLRSLPDRTKHVWLCAGGDLTFAVWGAYCWNPAQYAPDATERIVIEALLGPGTYEPYAALEREARTWAYRFAGDRHPLAAPGGTTQDTELAALAASATTARQQFNLIRDRTAATRPRPALLPPAPLKKTLAQLEGDVTLLERALDQGRTGRVGATVTPFSTNPDGTGVRHQADLTIRGFLDAYALRYAIHEEPTGQFRRCQWHFGAGLGKRAPSCRNWYDAGFLDVEVNGVSLDTCKAEFRIDKDPVGHERIVGRWDAAPATVTITFDLTKSGALVIDGQVEPKGAVEKLEVKLWCIPSAGSGDWKDMDRWLATPSRELQNPQKVKLDPATERWCLYYDRTYDVPHDKAEGPCALMFSPAQVTGVEVDLQPYVVGTRLEYPAATHAFRLAIWDLHGMRNADALNCFRQRSAEFAAELDPVK